MGGRNRTGRKKQTKAKNRRQGATTKRKGRKEGKTENKKEVRQQVVRRKREADVSPEKNEKGQRQKERGNKERIPKGKEQLKIKNGIKDKNLKEKKTSKRKKN